MIIKVRKVNSDGSVRLETATQIKEVMIHEDFLHPDNESVAIGFKGQNSSGIIEFTAKELDIIFSKIKTKRHLIKGVKIFKE